MKYKVLAVDGGGIRGIYPAYILKRLSEDLQIDDITKHFNLLVGTSTGSIITGALSGGVDADTIYNLYRYRGNEMFERNPFFEHTFGLYGSKYSKRNIEKILDSFLGNAKMSDLNNDLILTATNVKHGKAVLFRNRDDVLVKDAILASISAPFFFSFESIDNVMLADGGLWANNPSIVGYIEARYKLGIPEEDIHILSLGTGYNPDEIYLDDKNLNIHELGDFINLLLILQRNHTDALSNIILGEKFVKVDMMGKNLKIDKLDPTFVNNMERSYQQNKRKLIEFINLK